MEKHELDRLEAAVDWFCFHLALAVNEVKSRKKLKRLPLALPLSYFDGALPLVRAESLGLDGEISTSEIAGAILQGKLRTAFGPLYDEETGKDKDGFSINRIRKVRRREVIESLQPYYARHFEETGRLLFPVIGNNYWEIAYGFVEADKNTFLAAKDYIVEQSHLGENMQTKYEWALSNIKTNELKARDEFIRKSTACGFAHLFLEKRWQVNIGFDDSPTIAIPTDPVGAREVFRLRDIPDGQKRRKALLHWVREHYRQSRSDDGEAQVLVREHLRGETDFAWNGLRCSITPSDGDIERLGEGVGRKAKEAVEKRRGRLKRH